VASSPSPREAAALYGGEPNGCVRPKESSPLLPSGSYRSDQREAEKLLVSRSSFSLFLVQLFTRPGAVKGAPIGAAKRNLDGEDRCERIDEEGKGRTDSSRFLKRNQRNGCDMWQPWFYLRLEAYSFLRLSEGA
jgi:hypothetical protein